MPGVHGIHAVQGMSGLCSIPLVYCMKLALLSSADARQKHLQKLREYDSCLLIHDIRVLANDEYLESITCDRCRLYKGITPLWGRQIPYTMMKFGEFSLWSWSIGSSCACLQMSCMLGICCYDGSLGRCSHANQEKAFATLSFMTTRARIVDESTST